MSNLAGTCRRFGEYFFPNLRGRFLQYNEGRKFDQDVQKPVAHYTRNNPEKY